MTPEEHLADVMLRARRTAGKCSDMIRANYPLARDVERIREERPAGWEEAVAALDTLARAYAYFRDARDIVSEAASHAINAECEAKHHIQVGTM